jgi:hypothetical protein
VLQKKNVSGINLVRWNQVKKYLPQSIKTLFAQKRKSLQGFSLRKDEMQLGNP